MSNSSQENAMTEIALAMAMGFFSVMVLTAISMGVPAPKTPENQSTSVSIAILAQIARQLVPERPASLRRRMSWLFMTGSSTATGHSTRWISKNSKTQIV